MMSESRNDLYGYNQRNELISSRRAAESAETVEYEYAYDDIGNRLTSFEIANGRDELVSSAYTANNLNQYTFISNSAFSALSASPRETFSPAFDDDGNQTLIQTLTGIWQVQYNGENRPVSWLNGATNITMRFDRMGRRVEYIETVAADAGGSQLVATNANHCFVYDGYLCIQRLNAAASNSIDLIFAWDPSEPVATRPLMIEKPGKCMLHVTHDGNKSVSDLLFFKGGSGVVAHYEYAPFGSLTASTRNSTSTAYDFRTYNPFRFSSEYADDALGLVYYNYRHYNCNIAVWNTRDKIGEHVSLNLYSFCTENPFVTDMLGLKAVNKSKCPVVVKKENDKDGTEVIMPGATYTGTQDGVYSCCNTNESCVVYKTVDGIDVTVTDYGFSASGGNPLQKLGQVCKGGCKDKKFLEENTNWPSLDKVKELCNSAKKQMEDERRDRK